MRTILCSQTRISKFYLNEKEAFGQIAIPNKTSDNNPFSRMLGGINPQDEKFAKKAYGQYLLDQVNASLLITQIIYIH